MGEERTQMESERQRWAEEEEKIAKERRNWIEESRRRVVKVVNPGPAGPPSLVGTGAQPGPFPALERQSRRVIRPHSVGEIRSSMAPSLANRSGPTRDSLSTTVIENPICVRSAKSPLIRMPVSTPMRRGCKEAGS